jgi:cardiolipin synthase
MGVYVYKGDISLLLLVLALIWFIVHIAVIIMIENKQPSKTVAWLVVFFMCPFIGFLLYYFLGKSYPHRRSFRSKEIPLVLRQRSQGNSYDQSVQRESTNPSNRVMRQLHSNERLAQYIQRLPSRTLSFNNDIVILSNPKSCYQAILEAILDAQHTIHFQFYTIRDDEIGTQFQEALIQKAKQGVKVKIIFDGMGSYPLSYAYIEKMKQYDIEICEFLPPVSTFIKKKLNYRNHRKVVVLDGTIGFLGGINIGDEYVGSDPALGFWRDTHVKLVGDAVHQLQSIFLNDWFLGTGQSIPDQRICPKRLQDEGYAVQIIESGPDLHEDPILEMFFAGIIAARERIYMATPYFIPDISVLMGLRNAAASGIDVRIILPDKVDSMLAKYASQSFMEELMHAGVKFYSYQKGFMHAKIMIIDHTMVTLGSANMDMRSFYSNFEVLAVMYDLEIIERIEMDFLKDIQDSIEINLSKFKERTLLVKGKECMARLLSPFL